MYIVGKYKDIYNKKPINLKCGVSGEWKIILRDLNLNKLYESEWFPNLITDLGLSYFANGGPPSLSWNSSMHIGSSNAAPSFTDTQLGAYLAGSATAAPGGLIHTAGIAPNYEFSSTWGRRFAAGTGTGTIRELGHSYKETTGGLSIRTLVSPEVPKAVDQVLDLFYKFTVWPSLTDNTGVVSIAGNDYDYICRSMNLGNIIPYTYASIGPYLSTSVHHCHTGNIAAITSWPNSLTASPWSQNPVITGRGSGYLDYRLTWGLDSANSGGVRSISTRHSLNQTAGDQGWQIQFNRQSDNAKIEKDNTKELHLDFRISWARH